MAGPFVLYDAAGNEMMGDTVLTQDMKNECDDIGEVIKDLGTGLVVYPEGAGS